MHRKLSTTDAMLILRSKRARKDVENKADRKEEKETALQDVWWISHQVVPLFATPWSVARQAPLSLGCPRQGSLNGLPYPPPGDLPDPGIEPGSAAVQADFLATEPPGKTPLLG